MFRCLIIKASPGLKELRLSLGNATISFDSLFDAIFGFEELKVEKSN
jgi:hypothetical protein